MGLIGIIKNILRPTPKLSDRDRIRNHLVKETALAEALAGFLLNGYNHGRSATITVEIDGLSCEVSILAMANEPLMEYLCNWICAQKLKKHIRLEEFDKAIRENALEVVGPGSWVIRKQEKQILTLPDDVYGRLYPSDRQTGESGQEKTGPRIDPEGP
jgi:hypothetical protein